MRSFTAIVLVMLFTSISILPALAQGDTTPYDYNYSQPNRSPQQEKQPLPELNGLNASKESDWNWWHLIWITALFAIFLIFRANHDKKQLVKAGRKENGESGAELRIFTQKQLFLVYILLGIIFFSLIFLVVSAHLTAAAVLLAVLVIIVFSYWDSSVEVWQSLTGKKGNDNKKAIVIHEKTTFKDVGGLEEVIEELRDTVSLYKDPKDAEWWDIRFPKGILLVGPPGCGKTLLARAIAGETKLPFFPYSGSQIGNSYVRSGAQDIISIFEEVKTKAPCVIFFDELDALGKRRGIDTSGEFDHALTELLNQMDGIGRQSGVLVLAATNREDIIDEALLRPGRFDKKILIPNPDFNGRLHILKIHTAKKHLAPNVNLEEFSRRTPAFNGATLEQLTNEAAQLARRRYEEEKKKRSALGTVVDAAKEFFVEPERVITKADFEEAILRVQMGPARKLIMSEDERRIVARHEIGHAIVTIGMGLDVLDKVMLMPRNWALGLTETHGEERQLPSKALIAARLTAILGGRAAEEVFYGSENVTTGGTNDFEKAAELARRMICEWGMGKQGPAMFLRLDMRYGWQKPLSDQTLAQIDREVGEIISSRYLEAKRIISDKKNAVHFLAERLIEKTVLYASDITEGLKELQPQ